MSNVSSAVVSAHVKACVTFYNNRTASNLSSAITTQTTFFNHMGEIGGTAWIEALVKSSKYLETQWVYDDVTGMVNQVTSALSVSVTQSQIAAAWTNMSTRSYNTSLQNLFNSQGSSGVQTMVLNTLQGVLKQLQSSAASPEQIAPDELSADLCAYIGLLTFYEGVWGAGLATGALVFGPAGEAILAGSALGLGLAGLFCI